jgi:hypothetical protein
LESLKVPRECFDALRGELFRGFVQNLRVKKDTDRKISGKRLSSPLSA